MTRLIASTLALATALSASASAPAADYGFKLELPLAAKHTRKLSPELAVEAAALTGSPAPSVHLQLPNPESDAADFRQAARGGFVVPQLSLASWAASPRLLAWGLAQPLAASRGARAQTASPSPAATPVLDVAFIISSLQALKLGLAPYPPAHQVKSPAMLPWPPAPDVQASPAWGASVAHPPMQFHIYLEASF